MSTTQIQQRPPQPMDNIRGLLHKMESQIAIALPKHLTAERMIRVTLTALQRTPKLLECDPMSIIGSVMTSSQLGIEPDGILGQAYLVPFWNGKTKRFECQLQVGYRGYIQLARRSGEVATLFSELVYEHDKFRLVKGDNPHLDHEPNVFAEDRGKLLGAYAVVKYKDGSTDFEFLNMAELNKIRASSKSKDREGNEYGPWVTHPEEMYKKTPIRRLAKRLPLSSEFMKAANLDEIADAGVAQHLAAEVHASQIVAETSQNRLQALKTEMGLNPQPAADAEATSTLPTTPGTPQPLSKEDQERAVDGILANHRVQKGTGNLRSKGKPQPEPAPVLEADPDGLLLTAEDLGFGTSSPDSEPEE